MLQQAYATLRDLDELGVAPEALAMLTPAHKRRGILAASGRIAGHLRGKHALPLTVDVTPLDINGLVGGATASLSIGNPGPVMVQDIVVKVSTGGVVGVVGVLVQVSLDAGATYGAPVPLPLTGQMTIDGVELTLAGTLGFSESVEWSTCVDAGLCEATVAIAAYILLNNRGLAPETQESLEKRWEKAEKWAEKVAAAGAFLDPREDATPDDNDAGPLGIGQTHPWDFLDAVDP